MDNNTDKVGIISKYFPQLSEHQQQQFAMLYELYNEWNARINVISRADMGNLYIHHVLHSLAIARFMGRLSLGTALMDLGCGGGFPGIPLAIFYPDCHFHLIDRIGKKIKVASNIAESIGLTNVSFQHGDSGECHERFSYIVSRAVMPLPDLVKACRNNIIPCRQAPANAFPPGLICLKGGDLDKEIASTHLKAEVENIALYFTESFFETKKVVYIPL